MRRIGKRALPFLLAAVIFMGQALNALALWEGVTAKGAEYRGHEAILGTTNDVVYVFQLEPGESPVMPLESFTTTATSGFYTVASTYTPLSGEDEADFSSPVPFWITTTEGDSGIGWLMARPASSEWTPEEEQAFLDTAPRWLEVRDRMIGLLEALEEQIDRREAAVGAYQTAYQPLLYYLRNYGFWGMVKGSEVPAYGKDEVLYTEETLRVLMQLNLSSWKSEILLKADQTLAYLDCLDAFCDEIENNRIAEPELTGFRLGDYTGIIDGAAHVTLTVPEGASLPDPADAVVERSDAVTANWFAGSLESGQLLYRLTPYTARTNTLYNGTGGYAFDTDLGKTWMVEIRRGDPVLQVQSLTVTVGERTYRARIDEEAGTILLTLPEGTDLTSLTPVLTHTAARATVGGCPEGTPADLSRPVKVELELDTYAREYELTVETGPSRECEILSYALAGQTGIIDGDRITVTLPYGTELQGLSADVAVSEDAYLAAAPERLEFGMPLTYTVQAQSGDVRTYTVTLTETPASHENELLSFSYGSIQAKIDQDKGLVTLQVPEGTDLTKLAPTVRVSDFAGVYPASGEAADFSGGPVAYTVTSQSGITNTYRVSVELVSTGENIYKASMEKLLGNIIRRYETSASDDWEWMNLGFYQGITREPSPDALPEGLGLHARIKKLDTSSGVAMTDFDRTIMMLTALGIDASKLDQYTTEDAPFVDAKGDVVTDLTACLYNYSGGYTINGPIFALIALDMGNYTIPENAVWTRERLLETILTHQYGTDGFGVDMVGMLMQAIAPYQDDPVYGERVKAKLEEGIGLFLGESKAPTVDAMQPDFTFGGFGYQSSESAAQALCALSAAGVDCHTDPRFSDGKGNSALTAFLAYADGEYFAHTMDVPKNAMATYQGCYTVQWYLGFLEGGGAGHPYSLYYHQQDFSRPLSAEARIESFELEGKTGVIDDEAGTILVTLPEGTPLSDLTPELTLSDYASLDAPSLPVTFAENVPQPFTVRAEDGVTTKTYYVTVTLADGLTASGARLDPDSLKLQDAKILRDLEITGRTVTESDGVTDILLKVSAGVDTENLYLSGTVSYGAVTDPAGVLDGKTKLNLSGWNTIRVIAQDGEHTGVYRIRAEAQATASIESFTVTIDGTAYRGVVDDAANTIRVTGVPSDADVTSLAPDIVLGEGTNVCSPLSGVPQNFSSTVNYTVSGDGLASRVYAVDLFDADGNRPSGGGKEPDTPETPTVSAASIRSFRLFGTEAVIDDAAGTILLTLPEGTDLRQAAPEVTVGTGCTVSPVSGEVVDLTSPRVYTVTNGTDTSYYTVIVTLEQSVSQKLWEDMEDHNTITDHQVVRD
ncbi:MAG: hypothetical protein Q4C82_08595 [Eubacteriales bacterium]|nr:hypothetical protein [Eubacteriales bacterium]